MSKRKPEEKKQEGKKEFDPKQNYTWNPDDEFIVKGSEIDFINKVINTQLSTPESQRFMVLIQARDLLTNIFREAFEDGIVKEYVEPKKEFTPDPPKSVGTASQDNMKVVKEEMVIEAE